MKGRPYSVEQVKKEHGNSWTLVLKPEGHNSFNFKPGQFAWLVLGKTPFHIREHPFSLSSSAMKPERPELTIKELGDFTSTIGEVKPGTRAYMEGPYGRFTIDYFDAPGYIFLAGGVGITPIISMLKTMRDRADKRPVILFYGTKTWEDTLFREDIDALKDALNLQVIYFVEEPDDDWRGEKGFITEENMAKYLPESRYGYTYFVCGPEVMQKNVKIALGRLGISMEKVQSESFNFV
jgi:predicted ferric reductase